MKNMVVFIAIIVIFQSLIIIQPVKATDEHIKATDDYPQYSMSGIDKEDRHIVGIKKVNFDDEFGKYKWGYYFSKSKGNPYDETLSGIVADEYNNIYVSYQNNSKYIEVFSFSSNGEIRWETTIYPHIITSNGYINNPSSLLYLNGKIYLLTFEYTSGDNGQTIDKTVLYVLSSDNGNLLFYKNYGSISPYDMLLVYDNATNFIYMFANKIYAISPSTGEITMQSNFTAFTFAHHIPFAMDNEGNIYFISNLYGTVLRKVDGHNLKLLDSIIPPKNYTFVGSLTYSDGKLFVILEYDNDSDFYNEGRIYKLYILDSNLNLVKEINLGECSDEAMYWGRYSQIIPAPNGHDVYIFGEMEAYWVNITSGKYEEHVYNNESASFDSVIATYNINNRIWAILNGDVGYISTPELKSDDWILLFSRLTNTHDYNRNYDIGNGLTISRDGTLYAPDENHIIAIGNYIYPVRNLTATYYNKGVNLTWKMPEKLGNPSLTEYEIYRNSYDNRSNATLIATVSSNTLHYRDTTVSIGKNYYYWVEGVNGRMRSIYSYPIHIFTADRPDPPQNLNVVYKHTGSKSYNVLSWYPPDNDGGTPITNYNVYRGTNASNMSLIKNISVLHETSIVYYDTNIKIGVGYYYYVTAVNKIGESNPSNWVFIIPTDRPSPPRNLEATGHDGFVYLSWLPPNNNGGGKILHYKIYRGISKDKETLIATISSQNTEYYDRNVTNGQTYYYYVTAVNKAGESSASNEVSVMPKHEITKPTPPRNLHAKISGSSIVLTWQPPENDGGSKIIQYRIYRGTSSGNEVFIMAVKGNVLRYVDNEVKAGKTYYYRVTAVNVVGESAMSPEISIKIQQKSAYPVFDWLSLIILLIIIVVGGVWFYKKRFGKTGSDWYFKKIEI